MEYSLRRRHMLLWIMISIIGSVLIVFCIDSIGESISSEQEVFSRVNNSNLNVLYENESLDVAWEELNNSNKLYFHVKRPFKAASTLVSVIYIDAEEEVLLGSIEGSGVYRFDVNREIVQIRFFDEIKNQEILKVNL